MTLTGIWGILNVLLINEYMLSYLTFQIIQHTDFISLLFSSIKPFTSLFWCPFPDIFPPTVSEFFKDDMTLCI